MDCFFGKGMLYDEVFKYFYNLGVKLVCFILGKDGVKFSEKGCFVILFLVLKVEKIMDVIGVGDVFWSGFLFVYLKEKLNEKCMEVVLKMVVIKL